MKRKLLVEPSLQKEFGAVKSVFSIYCTRYCAEYTPHDEKRCSTSCGRVPVAVLAAATSCGRVPVAVLAAAELDTELSLDTDLSLLEAFSSRHFRLYTADGVDDSSRDLAKYLSLYIKQSLLLW